MSGTCRNCQHWDRLYHPGIDRHWGVCDSLRLADGTLMPRFVFSETSAPFSKPATPATFGCNQYLERRGDASCLPPRPESEQG